MARKLATLLTVADIARQRGVALSTARRWLLRLHKRSRGRVILRDGPTGKMYTTLSLLRRADPRLLEENEVAREDLRELRERVHDQAKRIGALGARVRELQAIVERLAAKVA